MATNNTCITEDGVEWIKSTGDNFSLSKGKHKQQVSPDSHPTTVHKMNVTA